MKLFTKKDVEWMTAHGMERVPGIDNSPGVDFYAGDVETLHVEIKKFNVGNLPGEKYEVTVADTITGIWMIGCGDTLQSALDEAIKSLEKSKHNTEKLIDKTRKFCNEKKVCDGSKDPFISCLL